MHNFLLENFVVFGLFFSKKGQNTRIPQKKDEERSPSD